MFGKSVPLDRHLFVSRSEIADNLASKALTVWAQNMLITQDILLGKARQALQERDENHLATQKPNLTIPVPVFSLGSYVLVEYPRAAGIVSHRGPPNKLMPLLKGLMKIIKRDGDTYTVQSLLSDASEAVHVTRLRRFVHDASGVDEAKLRDATSVPRFYFGLPY